ncbi:enoyl-CoA hydratase-related protein [Streptomyces sp. DSM 44915]|uniref:Enoyl-CoA hydratase-related protein n=1 Tax=Streptomyces chisholmiae TaxID=3075540 RepID=A0ABU2JSC3_9ACTN|nr:enoyl-CoA hydratase-related protein [Streptomyces sp. DSM 44915]MDT0267394.1 enoyl-CoA hydratase-related protein [Streptomyces sp. DSM 44915]
MERETEARDGVRCRRVGAVAVVELDRPPGNALDAAMRRALLAALAEVAAAGAAVRAVLLAGRGGAFCVGQDLREHAAALEEGAEAAFACVAAEYNPLVTALQAVRQPVVVAVDGACVGAGLGLALAGDVRVVGRDARFATAFTGVGLAADSGLSCSLARAVGPARARALFLLGDRFGAEEALTWGLAQAVVPAGTAGAEGLALAERLAAGPTAAFAEVKELFRAGGEAGLPAVLAREAAAQTRLGGTADHRAAVAAFLARERPTFEGR